VQIIPCTCGETHAIDPGAYQRLVGRLIAAGSRRPALPPFAAARRWPTLHVCPPVGLSPLDDVEELKRVLNDEKGGAG